MVAKSIKATVLGGAVGAALLLAVLSPTLDGEGDGVSARGSAQATPLTSPAVCVAATIGAPECLFIVAGLAYFTYGATTGDWTMQEAVDALHEWWGDNEGSAARNQVETQWGSHSEYLDPTTDMLTAYAVALAALNTEGWEFTNEYPGGAQYLQKEGSTATEFLTVETNIATPGNYFSCVGGLQPALMMSGLQHSSATSSAKVKLHLDAENSAAVLYNGGGGGLNIASANNFMSADGAGSVGWSDNDNCISAFGPHTWRIEVFPNSAAWSWGFKDLTIAATYYVNAGGTQATTTLVIPAIEWEFESAAPFEYVNVGGDRVYMPEDFANADEWAAGAAVPLVAGGEGEVIQPGETVAGDVDDPGFWGGLFGGVNGWLKKVWERLGDISETVTDIGSAVAALPTTIANLFNPALAWADFVNTQYPAAEDDFQAVVPFCYAAEMSSPVLLTGGSGDIAAFDVGLPGNTVEVVIPYHAATAAVTFPLSQIAVAAVVFLWALSKLRDPLQERTA